MIYFDTTLEVLKSVISLQIHMCDVRIVHSIIRVLLEKEPKRVPLMSNFVLGEIGAPAVNTEGVTTLTVDLLTQLKTSRLNLDVRMDEVSKEVLNSINSVSTS